MAARTVWSRQIRIVAPKGRKYTMSLFRKQAELLCCPSSMTGLSGNTGKFMAGGGVTCQGECGALTR